MSAALLERLRRGGIVWATFAISQRLWALYTRAYLAPQFNGIGRNTVIRRPRLIANPRGISVGHDAFIRDGVRLEVVDRKGEVPGRLVLGSYLNLEQNVHITSSDLTEIGDYVCIAANVVISGASHPPGSSSDGNRAWHVTPGPARIRIGSRVFIGANAVVLPNVEIGANTVIGAGAVVTCDIPADCVATGVPARVVKRLTDG